MDECEYLCNRLAIMANGRLKCIGPILQLKEQFNLGVLLVIIIKEIEFARNRKQIEKALSQIFPCRLRDAYKVSFSSS